MRKSVWLLDADMTLFDFEKAERFALRGACARFGVEISARENEMYHEINEALWRRLERGETTQGALQVERFVTFTRALGLALDARALAAAFVRELGEGCYLLPQALSLLQNLHRRCRVAIVTNGITAVQKRRLQLSGLSPYVDALVISEEEGVAKPDPRLLERALERLGCAEKAEAAMVGDSLTSDMAAAARAGLDGVWYNPKGRARPADAPPIAAEIRQLHDLMCYV